MAYALKDLVDIPKLQGLLDALDEIHSLPSAIIDSEGTILTATAWQEICTKFHRAHPEIERQCRESDAHIARELGKHPPNVVYQCPMGLVDTATPIVVEGRYLGAVFTGQLFTAPPDEARFIRQAREHGFDEQAYLAALRKVPLITEERLRKNLHFLGRFTEMLAEQGLRHQRQLETEAALRESEERLGGLAEALPDLLFTTDADGLITYASPSVRAILGWSPEEAVGRSFIEFLPPAEIPRAVAAFRAVVESGVPARELLLTIKHKDGSLASGELNGRRIVTGQGAVGTIGLIRDVTERRRAEEELREARQLLDEVQGLAKLGGWKCDVVTGRIVWTKGVYEIYGVDQDVNPSDVGWAVASYAPEDREMIAQAFKRAVDGGEPYDLELRFVRSDGVRLWVRTIGSPIVENGKVVAVAGTIADITERKRAELAIRDLNDNLERRVDERTAELQASNRELEALVYTIAHDLRAPLRAIDGYSGIVEQEYGGRLDQEGRRLLRAVRAGAHAMDRLIEDLLEYSHAGTAELRNGPVEMGALAQAAYGDVATDEVRRTFRFAVGELPPAWGDAALLRQVWSQLLANAIKFTVPRAERSIEIGGRRADGTPTYWVRDSGVGFDQAYAHKLFGVFERLHAAAAFEGTGIGLAIVQRIVARHGGRVWAEGAVDAGATFFFSLPGQGETVGSG
jgi:PAS domain S-box-containing protein